MTQATLVLIALLAQAGTPASETEGKAKAKALLGEGSSLYRKGDYAGALEKFEAAYASFPSPKLWFNIGQAHRDLGRPVEALEAFEKFLSLASDASPDTFADARQSANDLQKKLGQLRIDCDLAGAEISLDGRSLGQAPLSGPVWATPGHHQITAIYVGVAPAVESAEIAAATLQTVMIRFAPNPPPANALPPPRESPSAAASAPAPAAVAALDVRAPAPQASQGWWLGRKWTWVAAGSAVLLVGSAAIVGGLAESRLDDLKKSCGSGSAARPGCSESDINSLQTRMTTANVLWGVAGAAAVTAGVLFFVEDHRVAVAPMAGETKGVLAKVEF